MMIIMITIVIMIMLMMIMMIMIMMMMIMPPQAVLMMMLAIIYNSIKSLSLRNSKNYNHRYKTSAVDKFSLAVWLEVEMYNPESPTFAVSWGYGTVRYSTRLL